MALGQAGKEFLVRIRLPGRCWLYVRAENMHGPYHLPSTFLSHCLRLGCSMAVWASWQMAWWVWMISGRARSCESGQAMTMWDGATRASPMATWRWSLSLTGCGPSRPCR